MVTWRRYHVLPAIPQPLQSLTALAGNLWWSWNKSAQDLFARVDPDLLRRVGGNPFALLLRTPQERLNELARDAEFVAALGDAMKSLETYLAAESWYEQSYGKDRGLIGYFSMEFGIHEALPVYSGGLGVLAGDHLKSASDLGLPLVAIGVAFSQGYFRQGLDEEGWQREFYPPNDWNELPVSPVHDKSGARAIVHVPLPVVTEAESPKPHHLTTKSRVVALQAWRAQVGRIPLYLLDANLEKNDPEDRALTNTLYGGDRTHRIRQEILLGVGGVRLLRALGTPPTVCHMNEGHSAFLALERVREIMAERGASFDVAAEVASAGNIFTTHTPVPAGNDTFAEELIKPYLELLGEGLDKTADEVMAIGRVDPEDETDDFSMPVLAIRLADQYNGVSVLHGREARQMWKELWPELPVEEVPIRALTNGIHVPTWVGLEQAQLFDRHLGPAWRTDEANHSIWARVLEIPDREIWDVRQRCRARLASYVRARLKSVAADRGSKQDAAQPGSVLDPNALTIGFARRFATYKRGAILLRDPQRLERILSSSAAPVQLIFSGKAHPQDWGGKELIRDIVRASQLPQFRGRILFLEDYDMGVARELVSGVDVWLNTPRRPLEASGTSGMKAALNGAIHASILDGWWAEAYTGDNGFAIGQGEEYADLEQADEIEARALYRLLEDELIPEFYARDQEGLPRDWIARMKKCICTSAPVFNTERMVREYAQRKYVSASNRFRHLQENNLEKARSVTAFRSRMATQWPAVRIEKVFEKTASALLMGGKLVVCAELRLGSLPVSEVAVELYHGKVNEDLTVKDGIAVPMQSVEELGDGRYRFEGTIAAGECGEHAFGVRVAPSHEDSPSKFSTRLLTWH